MAELVHLESLPMSLSSPAALTDLDEGNEVNSAAAHISSSRQQMLTRHGTTKRRTDINAFWINNTSPDEALLSIIEEKDRVSYPEERIIAHVMECLFEGANIGCTDVHSNTPLHKAAWMGFPDLTKELLQRGADVHALNCDDQTPMEIAISRGLELDDERTEDYSQVAALVIKEMEPTKVRELFLCSPTEACKLKFRNLLCKHNMQEATGAVLDTLIERIPQSKKAIKVHYSLLEANDKGGVQSGNFHRESNFKYIVDTHNKALIIHPAVMLLIESKWKRFARNKLILDFIYWAITMIVLSLALNVGATSNDSTTYSTPVDYFRALCEGLMLLLITTTVIRDILLMYIVRWRFFAEYKLFIFTYFNIVTAVLLCVYIILHAVKVPERWLIASIVFVLYALKGFRFLLTIRSISNYVLILVRIIRRDIFTFLVVFAIVLLATTGGIYLEEQLFTLSNDDGMSVQNSTLDLTLPSLALIGIRMMVEGDSIIDYTSFGWLGYGTYLIFMFFVVVILQSLLIAQMSDTFTNVQVDAKRALILNRARTILNVEQTTLNLSWISKVLKLAKIKLTLLMEEVWEDPDKHLEEIELPESIVYTKKLMKLEKMMITQRELVEELRDSMMAEQRKLISLLKVIIGDPE